MLKKVLLVFGTRPEAIKMAPLVLELKKHPDIETHVCVTGQHREMLDQVLDLFNITPDYDLNIMKQGQDLYDITSRVILGMKNVLNDCKPNIVFVHGDTTTSTATALAAFYKQITVAHVEAGLRTYKIYNPWPEEMNRQITGRIASIHFAPTLNSKQNLLREGIHENDIYVTGNTVIDTLYLVRAKISTNNILATKIEKSITQNGYNIDRINQNKKLVLITGHRRENFGDGFINICNAIKHLSLKYPNVDFIYPMHLNPNVRKPINDIFGKEKTINNLFFIEPLEYLSFVYLMDKSYLVLTDSGGIQEEAPGFGKPVLVMRDTTERPEAVEAGTVKLVGTNENLIISEVTALIDNEKYYQTMSQANNPYGDGNASRHIVEIIKSNYNV